MKLLLFLLIFTFYLQIQLISILNYQNAELENAALDFS